MSSALPTSQPPPLPGERLRRVLRLARIDGTVLLVVAGGFALLSSACADLPGALVGFAAAACGYGELRGRRILLAGGEKGSRLLVGCQLALLGAILAYATYQYFCYNPAPLLARTEELLSRAAEAEGLGRISLAELWGVSQPQLEHLAVTWTRALYVAVGALSLIFQGGMALYYHRQCRVCAAISLGK